MTTEKLDDLFSDFLTIAGKNKDNFSTEKNGIRTLEVRSGDAILHFFSSRDGLSITIETDNLQKYYHDIYKKMKQSDLERLDDGTTIMLFEGDGALTLNRFLENKETADYWSSDQEKTKYAGSNFRYYIVINKGIGMTKLRILTKEINDKLRQ